MKNSDAIAVAHPGKIGDALWALPVARALAEIDCCPVDFYTSTHCEPMRSLVEAQDFIRRMVVPPSYVIKSMDCGVQPWEMPIEPGYQGVYQLGFQGCPDRCIMHYLGQKAGLAAANTLEVHYDLPPINAADFRGFDIDQQYLVLASRGETTYADRFRELCRLAPVPVLIVGALGEDIGASIRHDLPRAGVDMTGLSMLHMAQLISRSVGFVGLMSSPLVVANGFPVRKVVPHNGRNWDMRHVQYTPLHHYMVEPTVLQMLEALGMGITGSRL